MDGTLGVPSVPSWKEQEAPPGGRREESPATVIGSAKKDGEPWWAQFSAGQGDAWAMLLMEASVNRSVSSTPGRGHQDSMA